MEDKLSSMMPTTVTTITHYSSSLTVFSACIMSSELLNFFRIDYIFLFFDFATARGDSSAAYLFAGLANGQLAVFDSCVIQVPFHTL